MKKIKINPSKNLFNKCIRNMPLMISNKKNFHSFTKFENNYQIKNTTIHAPNKIKKIKNYSKNYTIEVQTLHKFAESVSSGEVKTITKKIGDYIAPDEVIIELETEKTDIPINAKSGGYITELYVTEGGKVNEGEKLFAVDTSRPPPSSGTKSTPTPSSAPKQETAPPKKEEVKTPLPTTTPTPTIKQTPTPSPTTTTSSSSSSSSSPSERRVKLPLIRRRIAQRLKDSQNTYALLTTFQECDMSFVTNMRNKYKDEFVNTHGVKLGFMSAFVKASSYALTKFPEVNAVMDGEDIIYRDYVDISVAVATPKGLVVPVIRGADKMSFAQIEQTIIEYGKKAKDGKLAIEDMTGGTFTISNGGVYGSMMGTPIVNPPQSAILGMHNITNRAVVVDGKIEIRPIMYLALTYDHRIIDGKGAVSFLRTIKHCVEDPTRILLDL